MDWFLSFILCGLLVQISVAPPVTKDKTDEEHDDKENNMEVMEYHRYLKEVVDALESDPDFRSKLEKAGESDIRTGKIANELEFVNHKVRTRLDELKREELERLRHLAIKENQLSNGLDLQHLKIAQHLDHSNTLSFEIDDLKKLIAKTTEDLAEADRRRRQQFKEYEMQKKFEEEQKMNAMNLEEKQKYIQQLQEMKEKHKKHEPLHHPGSKQQLEEVWEKQDHMDSQDFDLQKFFYFHDIDGNGVWDQNEVKALFLKDLEKLYEEGAPEDDLLEREEEMERMREHVFNEADLNKDGLISYQEFLEQTKKPDFQQDRGWKALDEQQIYSQEEYEAFEKRRREEIQALIAKGILPPYEDNIALHNEQFPPQHGSASGHPQASDNSVPPQQYQYQAQPIQQQYYPQQIQVPQQHYQGQVPIQQQQQQQQHYNQLPQQQYQGQMMPQGGQFHGQVPLQPNQIPVQQQQQIQQPQQQFQHPNVQAQIPQQQQTQQQQPPPQQQQQQLPPPQQQQQTQQQQPPPQQPQQQQNVPNQIPQQPNTQNQIPQQQPVQNQTPQQQNIAGQINQNHIVQQTQQPLQNSAQHIQQNSIHNSGKV